MSLQNNISLNDAFNFAVTSMLSGQEKMLVYSKLINDGIDKDIAYNIINEASKRKKEIKRGRQTRIIKAIVCFALTIAAITMINIDNLIIIGVIIAVICFLIKNHADCYAVEFWKDVEASICTIPEENIAETFNMIVFILNRVEIDKLPIIIKHAPTPVYRRLATEVYTSKNSDFHK